MKVLTKKRRLGHFAIGAILFLGIFTVGTLTPLNDEESKMLLEAMAAEIGPLLENMDPMFIAVHNISIALAMFIPGFGFIWGSFAGYQTGLLISAMASQMEGFEGWMGLALFITPVGILELSAYALAMSRSWLFARVLLKKAYRTKENIKGMIKPILIESAIVVTLLVIGGFVETWMIAEFGSDSLTILEGFQ
jgi:uncharacterized membrane protein SpoIIM required for sporulation